MKYVGISQALKRSANKYVEAFAQLAMPDPSFIDIITDSYCL